MTPVIAIEIYPDNPEGEFTTCRVTLRGMDSNGQITAVSAGDLSSAQAITFIHDTLVEQNITWNTGVVDE